MKIKYTSRKLKLEDVIKQDAFKSEYHKLLVNILFTGNWLNSRIAGLLRPFELTPQQYNLLRILRGQHPKPARVQLLQERMLDNMSNASRLVERLRKKGFADRKICINDRRAVDVLITEKGLKLLKQLDEKEKEWLDSFEVLSRQDAKLINDILDKLRN